MSTYVATIVTNDWPTGLVGTIGYTIYDANSVVKIARTIAGITESGIGSYTASPTLDYAWGELRLVWDANGDTASESLPNTPNGGTGGLLGVTAGPAIFAQLSGNVGVAALADDRIVPALDRDRWNGQSVCVYDVQDNEAIARSYAGAGNLSSYRVTIHSIGKAYSDAAELARAVKAALDDQSGTWGGIIVQGAFFEDENDQELSLTDDGANVVAVIEQTYTIVISTV